MSDTRVSNIVLLLNFFFYNGLEKENCRYGEIYSKSWEDLGTTPRMRVTLQYNDYTLNEGSISSDKHFCFVVSGIIWLKHFQEFCYIPGLISSSFFKSKWPLLLKLFKI